MPLTKRQFELRVDQEGENLMRQLYELLASHPEVAFSRQELEGAVLGTPIPVTKLSKLRRALEVLLGISAVDQREVSGTDYYAFLQEFDTNTWVSKKLPF